MRSFALSPQHGLRAVFGLRLVSLLGQSVCLITALSGAIHLPSTPLLVLLIVLSLICAATAWRLRLSWPVTDFEFTAQLVVDIGLLSLFLFFTGGPYNPFVSLYLVPVAMAAATLPALPAWGVAAGSGIAYTVLMVWHRPLPHIHGDAFNLHVTGMWLNYLLSASLIAAFVGALAYGLRQRDAQLAQSREDALRKERIVALGALAAGAAHELSTPLNTLLITVSELQAAPESEPLREDLQLLREQIELCKTRLRNLLATQDQPNAAPVPVRQWLTQTLQDWRRLRPEVTLATDMEPSLSEHSMYPSLPLSQCLSTVLNNAADASRLRQSYRVQVRASLQSDCLSIQVEDDGPGPSPSLMRNAGRVFFTDKPQGFGLGLVLSDATLTALSGELRLREGRDCGTVAEIRVPLLTLQMGAA